MSQSSAKGVNVPVSGDLTGSIPNPTVVAINGTSVPASPAANTVLTATSSIAAIWQQITNAHVSPTAAIAVSKLAAGTSGQILQNNGTPTPTWTTISGDVSITNAGATTVIALQNIAVSSTAPATSQVLQYNGTNWAPATFTTTLAGDVTGPIGSNTVVKINGASVPVSGSLTTGNVLQVSGSSALSYGAVNLAGGANFVTGVLPAGNQANQSMGGDVTGTTGSSTVAKIQGNTVTSGALTKGQFFVASSTSNWAATTLSGDISESATTAGLLTVTQIQSNPVTAGSVTKGQILFGTGSNTWAPTTVSGDVSSSSSTAGLLTVTQLQSVPVSSTAPTTNQVLEYNGTQWAPTTFTTTLAGDVTGSIGANTVVKIQNNTVTSGALTKGQFFVATSTSNWAATTLSGDVSESNTTAGLLTVIGIDGYAISGGPASGQILEYNGTNLVWVTPSSGVTWASDLAGSTNSNQWVAAISGNAGAGGSIPINATTLAFASGQSTPAVNQTALGSVATTGATGQTLMVNAQAGQPTTGAGNNAGNGGVLTLTSGAGGTASGGTPGVAGNLLLQTGGTTQATISTSGLSVASLAGSGPGFVAVNNSGLLSFVAGISPTGSAGGDLGGSYPNPTVVAIQTNAIQSGTLGASQDGYVLSWKNSASQWQALPITSGSVTLGGDVTGVATSNNVVSISGASPIVITPNEFRWTNTSVPLLDQAALASTSSGSGSAGQNFSLTAQAGQAATGASHNGGAGGNLILTGGTGGTSGSATAGNDGNVQINAGSTSIVSFYDWDFDSDGYVEPIYIGSSLATPRITQGPLTTTSSTNGSNGQQLYVVAQSGQAAIGGTHNGGNGGVLALSSGPGGTSGGGSAGTAGNLLLQTGGNTRVTVNQTGVVAIANLSTGVVHADSSGNLTSSTIVNADVSATANIAVSKLAAGTSTQFLMNNSTPTPTWTTLSGDVSWTSAGVATVTALQTNPVQSGALGSAQDGYVLTWHNAGPFWFAAPAAATTATAEVKSTTYTVLTTDGDIFADLSSAGWTLTLPSAPTLGEKHTIKDYKGFAGQSTDTGSAASLTFSTPTVTLTGGSGFTSAMTGLNITISNSTTAANNGTFALTFISSTSVSWTNASGAADASGAVVWSVANNLIISGNGKTIEQWGGGVAAASTLLLTQNYDAVTLAYNNTNWSIM